MRETVCWTNADKDESIASFEMLAVVDVRVRVDGGEGETLNDESSIESMAEKEANIAVSWSRSSCLTRTLRRDSFLSVKIVVDLKFGRGRRGRWLCRRSLKMEELVRGAM